MNQDQKKYLLKRIDEIKEQKLDKITVKVDIDSYLPKLRLVPTTEIMEKIKKFLLDIPNFSRYASISFNGNEITSNWREVEKKYDKAYESERKIISTRKDKLHSYCISLKDKIVFGKESEALEQLAKFEKMEF